MLRTLTLSIVGAAALAGIFASSASAGENKPAAAKTAAARTNPFFTASTLPFQAPPFDKIQDGDFKPALEEGMKQQRTEVEKIADNPAPATFENTLVALEKSGQLLTRVNLVFNGALVGEHRTRRCRSCRRRWRRSSPRIRTRSSSTPSCSSASRRSTTSAPR